MKILNLLILTLFTNLLNAQDFTGKININKDKKYEIVSSGTSKIIMPDMEMLMTNESLTSLKVGETSDTGYTLITKIEKLKLSGGKDSSFKIIMFDSEDPNDFQNAEIASTVAGKIGVEKSISLNRNTGRILNSVSENNDEDMIEKTLNPLSTEDISFNELFLLIPKKKKIGNSWTTEDSLNGFKTKTNYTIKEVKNNIASVDFNGISNFTKTFSNQGNNIFVQAQIIKSGYLLVNIYTGILQKKTMKTNCETATVAMGETETIKMISTSDTLFVEK